MCPPPGNDLAEAPALSQAAPSALAQAGRGANASILFTCTPVLELGRGGPYARPGRLRGNVDARAGRGQTTRAAARVAPTQPYVGRPDPIAYRSGPARLRGDVHQPMVDEDGGDEEGNGGRLVQQRQRQRDVEEHHADAQRNLHGHNGNQNQRADPGAA